MEQRPALGAGDSKEFRGSTPLSRTRKPGGDSSSRALNSFGERGRSSDRICRPVRGHPATPLAAYRAASDVRKTQRHGAASLGA